MILLASSCNKEDKISDLELQVERLNKIVDIQSNDIITLFSKVELLKQMVCTFRKLEHLYSGQVFYYGEHVRVILQEKEKWTIKRDDGSVPDFGTGTKAALIQYIQETGYVESNCK